MVIRRSFTQTAFGGPQSRLSKESRQTCNPALPAPTSFPLFLKGPGPPEESGGGRSGERMETWSRDAPRSLCATGADA